MKYMIFILLLFLSNIIFGQNNTKTLVKEIYPAEQVLEDTDNDGVSVGNDSLIPTIVWADYDPVLQQIIETDVPVHKFAETRDAIVLKPGFSYRPIPDAWFSAKTNDTIILPATDHFADFNSINFSAFDESLPVGSINGSFNVTPTGAATYSMQIEIPQGVQGMQPKIAVSYNSMGGMSNMGKGFSLSAISAITRTNQVPYYDDKWETIDFVNDKFAMDGQRLIVTNGSTYGADGTQYGTESYSPLVVTSHGNDGVGTNSPSYFTVVNAAGQTLTYGKDRNSQHKIKVDKILGIESPAFMWMLSEVKDKNGNKMLYHYGVRNGEHFIQKIQYINNGSDYLGEIEFIHETHGHPQKKYVGAGNIRGFVNQSLLLKEIRVNLNGKAYRKYEFDYFEDILPKLYQATVFDGNGNSLNSTTFEWGGVTDSELEMSIDSLDIVASSLYDMYFPWNYNGDGRSDMMSFTGRSFGLYWADSDGSGYTKRGNVTLDHSISSTLMSPLICDFDGDDRDEIVFVNFVHSGGVNSSDGDYYFGMIKKNPVNGETKTLNLSNSINGGGSLWNYVKRYQNFNNYDNPSRSFYLAGDFNGDGKSEICFNGSDHIHFFVYDEENIIVHGDSIPFASKHKSGDPNPFVGDFNGDGKNDIFFVENGDVSIFSFNDNLNAIDEIASFQINQIPFFLNALKIKYADINGDGKGDFFYSNSWNDWKCAIWNGDGFYSVDVPEIHGVDPESDEHELFFSDFNKDGITDILHAQRSASKTEYTSQLNIYLGDNSLNFKKIIKTENADIGNIFSGYIDEYDTPTDMDGDGYLDILSIENNKKIQLIKIKPEQNSDPNTVKYIRNGLNNELEIIYRPGTVLIYNFPKTKAHINSIIV